MGIAPPSADSHRRYERRLCQQSIRRTNASNSLPMPTWIVQIVPHERSIPNSMYEGRLRDRRNCCDRTRGAWPRWQRRRWSPRDRWICIQWQLMPRRRQADDGQSQRLVPADEDVEIRARVGELTHHLDYRKRASKVEEQVNHRNATTPETALSEGGAMPLAIPRNRVDTFARQLIAKHAWRLPKIRRACALALRPRGDPD